MIYTQTVHIGCKTVTMGYELICFRTIRRIVCILLQLEDATMPVGNGGAVLNSFRLRLALVVFLLLVPVLVLVLWSEETYRSQLIEDARGDALALTQSLANVYRQYIDNGHLLLNLLSQLPIIRNKDVDACNTLFASLLGQYDVYNGIFVVDTSTGLGLCSGRPYVEPVDNSGFDWYQKALNTRDFVLSDYRIGPQTGEPIVTLAHPVLDDEGQITAVVAASLSLRWLNNFVDMTVLPSNASLILTDAQGVMLVRYPERTDLVGQPLPLESVRSAALANAQGTIQGPGLDGTPRVYGYTTVSPEYGNLHVIVGIPESIILADADRSRAQSIVILGVITLFGVAGAWVSATLLIRPIDDLKNAIRRMASGELSSRTNLKADTIELQQLLLAFNEMAATVENRMGAQVEQLSAANAERAKLLEAERQARQEAETLAENLARLQAVTEALSQAVHAEDVTRITIDETVAMFGAKTGNFHFYNEAEQMFELGYSTSQLPNELLEHWRRFPADTAFPVTDAVRKKETIWFSSTQEIEAQYPAMAQFSTLSPGASAVLPIVVAERVLGAVSLTFSEPRTFDEDEIVLAQSIVYQCAQALERARLAEEAEAEATMRERQRLARDLHDAVSQTLYSAAVIAESIPRLWEREPNKALSLLEQVHTLNKAAGAEMRVLLWELRPEVLEKATPEELFTQLVTSMKGRKEMAVSLDLEADSSEPLPAPVRITFYRIAQEAVNNVIKHSQARDVRISLSLSPQEAELRISDDGRGFDEKRATAGMGLSNMRERAESIGATIAVTSAEGEGTTIEVRWQRKPDTDEARV